LLTFHKIASILNQTAKGSDHQILHVAFDSRMHVADAANTLFVGLNVQSHQFIADMERKGVRYFLLQQQTAIGPTSQSIVIDNPLQALQKLATHVRLESSAHVVGITGSNGKTMVKDALSAMLSFSDKHFVSSPRSYNSQLGVALSVLQLKQDTDIAIFEAGISKPQEMESLAQMINPHLGILTHIGDAHQEGFDTIEEKIKEKLKLFNTSSKLILNTSNQYLKIILKILKNTYKNLEIATIGEKSDADYQWKLDGNSLLVNQQEFKLKNTDSVALENILYAIVAGIELQLSTVAIQKGIDAWHTSNNRLSLLPGKQDSVIINDSYTNDFAALQAAVQFTKRHANSKEKCAIISSISPIKTETTDQIIETLKTANFKEIYSIGKGFEHLSDIPNYVDANAFIAQNNLGKFANKAILIKGQRVLGLEKISHWLEDKKNVTHLEIRLDIMQSNFLYFKSKLSLHTKIMVMVKAHAYGSGAGEVAKYLESIKPDYLGVAYVDEGIALRDAGIKTPILVLYADLEDMRTLYDNQLEPIIYSLEQWDSLQKLPLPQPAIHIELDTGMHRLGFTKKDLPALKTKLIANKTIKVNGILSHLSSADVPAKDEFTHKQITEFEKEAKAIESILGYQTLKHLANSAGINRFPSAHFDMVRLGIGVYGHTVDKEKQLQAVTVLKTSIIQIKKIAPNSGVGYGNHASSSTERTIAILPIGYADGFDRGLGNGNWSVLVNDKPCPTVGNICMDMCMVDISKVKCSAGDEVILFGNKNTVEMMSEILGTIPYEVIARISERVKRIYISEQ